MSAVTPVWRVVAEREITTRLRDKGFLAAIGVTLLLLGGSFVLAAIFGGGGDEYDVAVTDRSDEVVVMAAEAQLHRTGADDAELTVDVVEDTAAAETLVRDGEVDVALVRGDDGYELVGDDEVDDRLGAALRSSVASAAVTANAQEQGVDLESLQAGTDVSQRLLDPNADESEARSGVAFAFAIVFLLTAMWFGMTIAQSVAQEKESRVVEILAAAAPIRAMLWGKIIGNTVLALGQVLLLVTVGVVGLAALDQTDLLAGIGPAVAWYVAFFVLGFVALAALWSVAGALVSRNEDLQSSTLPGQMLLFIPYFVAALGSDDVRTVVSMVPVVSTMVMPGRMAEGSVPAWQVAVSLALTVAAAVVLVRVGARLYERTLLRTGSRIRWREAFQLQGRD